MNGENKMSYEKKKRSKAGAIACIVLFTALIAACVFALRSFSRSSYEKELQTVQSNLVRCAVSCYALEGAFPEDINYLSQNYGFSLDTDRYIYHYEYQGANLIPNIKVFGLGGSLK